MNGYSIQSVTVFDRDFMDPLFALLEGCVDISQDDEHHPEGSVFTHSLQVLRWAFRESIDTDLILAAMLHDIGKQKDRLSHDQTGVEMLRGLVSVKTLFLVEHHMRIWYWLLGDMKKLSKVKFLADHPWLPELVQLARWDKIGRNPFARVKYEPNKIIERLNRCANEHFRADT